MDKEFLIADPDTKEIQQWPATIEDYKSQLFDPDDYRQSRIHVRALRNNGDVSRGFYPVFLEQIPVPNNSMKVAYNDLPTWEAEKQRYELKGLLVEKTEAELLAEKQPLLDRIDQERKAREGAGTIAALSVGDVPILTTDAAQRKYSPMAAAKADIPAFRGANKSWYAITADDAAEVLKAAVAHVSGCYQRQKELEAKVDAGTFTEDDLVNGWP